jgi:TetR/AcrR family transcriptional regulator
MAIKPGERRLQILQTLASMLETPKGEKITTAALAAKLDCSEAALYRHFASKAQMFEGLIEFIEQSLFSVINQITSEESRGTQAGRKIIGLLLLRFAQKNRGMTRVLIGDAWSMKTSACRPASTPCSTKSKPLSSRRYASPQRRKTSSRTPTFGALANLLRCYASAAGSNTPAAASPVNR